MNEASSERDLVLALQRGDEGAFETIYGLYSHRLFGRLLKLVKTEAQAQEILQDVFIKLWQHRHSLDPEKSFRSFLFKIAENKVYDFFRKAARDKRMEASLISLSTTNYINIEEYTREEENLRLLYKAIESLPPQRQQVFRLCKLEGRSYKEVSELLSISLSTISDHIVKATKAIKEYFYKHPPSLPLITLLLSGY
jgi:RNA polymerase sigma-70 factor (ECF subfamily)